MMKFVGIHKQKGVVLFITMIALVVLLISCIALVRSSDVAQMISGNLAVKRDLTNQAEAAVAAAVGKFTSTLTTGAVRWNNLATANYSATALASNAQGIPNVLFDSSDAAFSTAYSDTVASSVNGETYRYVIDRLCPKTGDPDLQNCVTGNTTALTFTSSSATNGNGAGKTLPLVEKGKVVYRISVRVTDPRKTQTFLQTTVQSNG